MMSLYDHKGVESAIPLAMQGMEHGFKNRERGACTIVSVPDHTISQSEYAALSSTRHASASKHACCRECLGKLPM